MEPGDRPVGRGPFKIVYIDIDGTIVDVNQAVSARTAEALRRVTAEGRTLVLCTGRSRFAAERFAAELGCQGYGIVLNGAVTVDWQSRSVLRTALLPCSLVGPASKIAAAVGLACIWLGTEETSIDQYVENGAVIWPRYQARNANRIRRVGALASVPGDPASLVAYGTQQQAIALAQAWQDRFGAEVIAVAGPTAVYEAWYAQMTAFEADKAAAAAFVAACLHVRPDETVAIGDHLNDVPLLRWSGLGICMGDGHPEAKFAADYITGSIAEDGAAQALERYVLGQG